MTKSALLAGQIPSIERVEVLLCRVAVGLNRADSPVRQVLFIYDAETLELLAEVDPWPGESGQEFPAL